MKSILFYSTVCALILGAMSFFVSCDNSNKDEIISGQHYLIYNFNVADQVNVNKYVIEVSLTGNVEDKWEEAGLLFAIQGELEQSYRYPVDVTRWLNKNPIIYSRIKTVDNDGKIKYSTIQKTTKP